MTNRTISEQWNPTQFKLVLVSLDVVALAALSVKLIFELSIPFINTHRSCKAIDSYDPTIHSSDKILYYRPSATDLVKPYFVLLMLLSFC